MLKTHEDSRKALLKVAKATTRIIRDSFTEPDDDWQFVLLGQTKDGETMAIGVDPAFFQDDERKNKLAYEVLPKLIQKHSIESLAVVISTWQLAIDAQNTSEEDLVAEARRYGSISQHPDRYEALLVIAADKFGDEGYAAKIHRFEDRPPELDEWDDLPAFNGRFIDPLRTALRPQG